MDDLEPKTAALEARVEELAEALALTNEKLNSVLASVGSALDLVIAIPPFHMDGRLWQALRMKPIKDLTKDELFALNESAADRQSGKRIFSKDAVKPPTPKEYFESVARFDGGIDHALCILVKNIIANGLEGNTLEGPINPDAFVMDYEIIQYMQLR